MRPGWKCRPVNECAPHRSAMDVSFLFVLLLLRLHQLRLLRPSLLLFGVDSVHFVSLISAGRVLSLYAALQ